MAEKKHNFVPSVQKLKICHCTCLGNAHTVGIFGFRMKMFWNLNRHYINVPNIILGTTYPLDRDNYFHNVFLILMCYK